MIDELTYNYKPADGENRSHIWSVVGPAGGVHIWARPSSDDAALRDDLYYGGVEVHSRKPMYGEGPPHHDCCWLLNAPCWHDGSSLYFSENIAPMLREEPFSDAIREYVYSELHSFYRSNLDRTEDA